VAGQFHPGLLSRRERTRNLVAGATCAFKFLIRVSQAGRDSNCEFPKAEADEYGMSFCVPDQ